MNNQRLNNWIHILVITLLRIMWTEGEDKLANNEREKQRLPLVIGVSASTGAISLRRSPQLQFNVNEIPS